MTTATSTAPPQDDYNPFADQQPAAEPEVCVYVCKTYLCVQCVQYVRICMQLVLLCLLHLVT